MSWKKYAIGQLLVRNDRFERRNDEKSYQFAGVYSFRKGVLIRPAVKGSTFKLPSIQKIKTGDFIYSKIMAWEGAFALVPEEANNMYLSGAFVSYSVNRQYIIPEFLDYYFKQESVWKSIASESTGTNMRRRMLHPCQFEAAIMNVPSMEEQEIIVQRLNAFYTNVGELTKIIDLQRFHLEFLRQAILQEAVNGKLTKQNKADEYATELLKRIKAEKQKLVKKGTLKKEKELPPITEEEIPFELPNGWAWCRLGEITLKLTDGTHHSPTNVSKGEFMYVTAKNIKDDGVLLNNISYVTQKVHEEIYARCNPEFGDILYIKDGATTGVATINNLHDPFSMLSSVALIKLPKYISNKYILYVLRSPHFYRATRNDMAGIAITRVTLTKMSCSLIPLPPLAEQHRIAAKVQQLQQKSNNLERQVQQSRHYAVQLQKILLKEVFSTKDNDIPFERKVLAGHIINMCYQDNYFGLTKFQKTLHVCEHHAQVEYHTNYEQEVAGPYDRAFTLAFKKEMVEEDWFQQEMKVSLNRFVPGSNAGKLEKDFPRYFRNKGKEIRFVLQLFLGKTLEESELIATLYAVWNNRIIRKEPTDISQLVGDVYKWSERKAIYSREEITAMHSWMMEKGLVPTGFGKEIVKAGNNL